MEKEPSNAEATEKVADIGPLRDMQAEAKRLYEAHDYHNAVEFLSKLIDVSVFRLYYRYHNIGVLSRVMYHILQIYVYILKRSFCFV